jgi:hypothetical protein
MNYWTLGVGGPDDYTATWRLRARASGDRYKLNQDASGAYRPASLMPNSKFAMLLMA